MDKKTMAPWVGIVIAVLSGVAANVMHATNTDGEIAASADKKAESSYDYLKIQAEFAKDDRECIRQEIKEERKQIQAALNHLAERLDRIAARRGSPRRTDSTAPAEESSVEKEKPIDLTPPKPKAQAKMPSLPEDL